MSLISLNIFQFVLILGFGVSTLQNICGGIYLYDQGEILTPNYPYSYPANLICKWNISVAQNKSILLEFQDFYTDKKDYFNVYDVINGKLLLRGQFSGHDHPRYVLSGEHQLYMNLSTTSARKGFKLSYKAIDKCGGLYRDLTQNINSPGYPKRYFENCNCNWTIICPENRTINVKFLDLHLEDMHSFLTIFDADSNVLANLTGSKPQNILLTKSNKLFLSFKSDQSKNAQGFRGFRITYTTLVVGSALPFIISIPNAILITNQNQTIDNLIYNSVNEYKIVDYDIHKRKLLLFDQESSELILDHLENKRVVINARRDAITYDWIHGLVYWIDKQIKYINVIDTKLIESNIYSICQINGGNQRDLVINVEKSVLVWSQIGLEPKLWQIGSDGSDQNVFYSNERQAFHLTVYYESKRYYFVDISDFSLFSIDFNGNNENYYMTSRSFFESVISMTFHSNHLYLSNSHIIYRISDLDLRIKRAEILYRSGYRHEFTENNNFYDFKSLDIKRPEMFGFKIIDPILQPEVTNRCLQSNCDGLCLPSAQKYRCVRNLITLSTSSPVIMTPSKSGNTLAIINSVMIVVLVIILILLYFSLKQMIIKFENRIFQVLVPTVSFRKSRESKHEYENHDYEEPVFQK